MIISTLLLAILMANMQLEDMPDHTPFINLLLNHTETARRMCEKNEDALKTGGIDVPNAIRKRLKTKQSNLSSASQKQLIIKKTSDDTHRDGTMQYTVTVHYHYLLFWIDVAFYAYVICQRNSKPDSDDKQQFNALLDEIIRIEGNQDIRRSNGLAFGTNQKHMDNYVDKTVQYMYRLLSNDVPVETIADDSHAAHYTEVKYEHIEMVPRDKTMSLDFDILEMILDEEAHEIELNVAVSAPTSTANGKASHNVPEKVISQVSRQTSISPPQTNRPEQAPSHTNALPVVCVIVALAAIGTYVFIRWKRNRRPSTASSAPHDQ